jgi:hypothetical protein
VKHDKILFSEIEEERGRRKETAISQHRRSPRQKNTFMYLLCQFLKKVSGWAK